MVLILKWIIALNTPALPPVQEQGLATGYSAWKPEWMKLGGGRRLKTSTGKPYCWYHRKVRRGQAIIAHRTRPCGTKVHVTVKSTGRSAWLVVGDRGPYGACVSRQKLRRWQKRTGKRVHIWRKSQWCKRYGRDHVWYVKKHRSWPGNWRGVADISHTARKIIRHNGFQSVKLRYWSKRRKFALAQ